MSNDFRVFNQKLIGLKEQLSEILKTNHEQESNFQKNIYEYIDLFENIIQNQNKKIDELAEEIEKLKNS